MGKTNRKILEHKSGREFALFNQPMSDGGGVQKIFWHIVWWRKLRKYYILHLEYCCHIDKSLFFLLRAFLKPEGLQFNSVHSFIVLFTMHIISKAALQRINPLWTSLPTVARKNSPEFHPVISGVNTETWEKGVLLQVHPHLSLIKPSA